MTDEQKKLKELLTRAAESIRQSTIDFDLYDPGSNHDYAKQHVRDQHDLANELDRAASKIEG